MLLSELISEIKSVGEYDTTSDPNGYLLDSYSKASNKTHQDIRYLHDEDGWIKRPSIPGMPTNEVYTNGRVISIFIMKGTLPIFLLNLTNLAKGYSTTNVVTHSDHTGQGFAVPTYIAVSKAYGVPLYSFGTQTPAGDRIWQTLFKQYPDRVVGQNVKTGEDIPFSELQDGDFNTRAVLLP